MKYLLINLIFLLKSSNIIIEVSAQSYENMWNHINKKFFLNKICNKDVEIIDQISTKTHPIKNLVIFINADIKTHLIYYDYLLNDMTTYKKTLVIDLDDKNSINKIKNITVARQKPITIDKKKSFYQTKKSLTKDYSEIILKLDSTLKPTKTLEDINQKFLRKLNGSNVELIFTKDTKFIFLIESYLDLPNTLDRILKNPEITKVIHSYADCSPDDEIKDLKILEFLKSAWVKNRVINLFYISHCYRTCGDGNVYTFDPLFPNRYSNITIYGKFIKSPQNDLTEIKMYMNGLTMKNFNQFPMTVIFFPTTMAFLKSDQTVFPKNTSKNFQQNQLKSINSFFGVDAIQLEEFAKRINFTAVLSPTTDMMFYGFRDPSTGKFNGALGDVLYKRAEFILNGFFVKDYETRELEFSSSGFDEKLCIVVRKADLIPESLTLFRCFSIAVWIACGITVVIVSIIYTITMEINEKIFPEDVKPKLSDSIALKRKQKFQKRKTKYYLLHEKITDFFRYPIVPVAMLTSASTSDVGDRQNQRFFISMCALWSVNMVNAFTGSLIDVYTTPKSYPDINTLQGLDESGLKIAVKHLGLIVDCFGSEKPGTLMGNMRLKMFGTEDNEKIISRRISGKGDIGGLERLFDIPRRQLENIRPDGVSYIHQVEQCPKSYTIAYLFPRSSSFLEIFNYYILMFQQSGLISQWERDTAYVFRFEAGLRNRDFITSSQIQLTLKHLQFAFFSLCFGIIFSAFVFAFEIWIYRH